MLDYRLEELKQRKKNTEALRKQLESNKIDKWLKEKIENFCERHDLSFNLVKYKIIHDDLFVLNFIKEPSKQTLHQNLAKQFMLDMNCITDFHVLPASGKDSLFVINGIVMKEEQKKSSSVSVKSIDFEWKFKNDIGESIQCYASHKYTHQDGGAQTQQFTELMTFLENAQKHKQNLFFYAICDGRFYQSPYEGSLTKIEYLNKNYSGHRCHALTINDLESHMKATL